MTMTQRSVTSSRAERHRIEVYLLPVLVTLLAMALNLHRLDSQSLWFDELATLTGAGWRGNWLDAIQKPLTIPTTPKPPLSYVVTHLFLLLGERDFFLRLPAAVFATLTIPLVYALGRALFDRQVGLLGAFLLAIAPLQIRYAQEARMYAMWSFLLMLSLYLFWRAVRSQEGRWWFLFAVATILALYSHLFALLALGVMILFALWVLVRPAIRTRFPFRSRHFIVALVFILLAYAPMIPFLSKGLVSGEGLGGEAVPDWGLGALVGALRLFSGGNDVGSWVCGSLLVLAAVVMAWKDREALTLAALWIALPFIIILGLPFGHNVRIRYFLFVLPVYLLLVAYGLRVVTQWLVSRAGRLKPLANSQVTRVLAGVTLLGILAAINVPSIAAYYAETKQNWRDATRLVCTLAEPGDQIFVRHLYHQVGVLYYAKKWCKDPDAWTEASVHVQVRDLAEVLSPDDGRRYWLIVPNKDEFLPGGKLDASLQPTHHLLPATVFSAPRRPKDWGIISPTAFRTVSVVPVVPSTPESIRFWAEPEILAPGDCAWLRWQVDNVREVYLDGEGVVGHDQRQVCPSATTSYQLKVVRLDGTETVQTVEVRASTP
jgi:mannosyltransferase